MISYINISYILCNLESSFFFFFEIINLVASFFFQQKTSFTVYLKYKVYLVFIYIKSIAKSFSIYKHEKGDRFEMRAKFRFIVIRSTDVYLSFSFVLCL